MIMTEEITYENEMSNWPHNEVDMWFIVPSDQS
jgi:hypothetical protein